MFAEDDLSIDWTLRHGRSAALMVGLKEGPSFVYTDDFSEKINRTLLNYLVADRVTICSYQFNYTVISIYFIGSPF